jgi:hypothetical protein
MIKETLDKLKNIIEYLEKEYGHFLLFALFLREDPVEKWDIVISASWLRSNKMIGYKTVAYKIQEILSLSELIQFSRIIILDDVDPMISFLQKSCSVSVKNGKFKESPKDFLLKTLSEKFGFKIKKAYVQRCQKKK